MSNFKPLTILLVEDNIDHADLMIETLQEFNVKNVMHHVKNGEEAIAYLKSHPPYHNRKLHPLPDIVFLDLRMPKLDGLSTLKIIRNDMALRHIPVVVVTTSQTEFEIQQCFDYGANSYITKPVQFEDFSRKIRELNYYWILTSEIPRL